MPDRADTIEIVLSESNFACLEGATAKGSPVRTAVEKAGRDGRMTSDSSGKEVMITCSEAQAEELLRLAQVSCRGAMQVIKTALADGQARKGAP
jgi:hypothetical protein